VPRRPPEIFYALKSPAFVGDRQLVLRWSLPNRKIRGPLFRGVCRVLYGVLGWGPKIKRRPGGPKMVEAEWWRRGLLCRYVPTYGYGPLALGGARKTGRLERSGASRCGLAAVSLAQRGRDLLKPTKPTH
jgi:hypothetical protein